MAVCGRCLICGHKFSCSGDDEAVRWTCRASCNANATETDDLHEHAICVGCHDLLVGDDVPNAVNDLLALVRARRSH